MKYTTDNGFEAWRGKVSEDLVIKLDDSYNFLKEAYKNDLPKGAIVHDVLNTIFVIDKRYLTELNELMLKTVGWSIPSYV